MVHRHSHAAYAYALGMGFQRVGLLRVDDGVLRGGDVVRAAQRDAHVRIVLHAGKGGGDVQRRDTHVGNLRLALAVVLRVDGKAFVRNAAARGRDAAVRDIDVRGAVVDDARVADAHAEPCADADRRHGDLGTVVLLSLQRFDVDVPARDGGAVQRHVRVVVRMDDGVGNAYGSAAHRDRHILLFDVVLLLGFHVDVSVRRQDGLLDRGMDALLVGLFRGHVKADGHVPRRAEVAVRAAQSGEFRAADAERALRAVHAAIVAAVPVQMQVDFIFGGRIDVHGVPFFIAGARKLGFRDALAHRGDRHVDAHAEAAHGDARHAAVKAALFRRLYVDVVRRRDFAARHLRTGAAVDVVQGDGHADTADACRAHAAPIVRRQFVRGFHVDVVRFQLAVGHKGRRLAGGVVDADVRREARAEAHGEACRDEGFPPVVRIVREDGDVLCCFILRFQVAAGHFRLDGGDVVHDGHARACRHGGQASGGACRDILRVAVAKMRRPDIRRAVKFGVHVFQQGGGGAGVLMAHDAVSGSDAHLRARARSRREGQRGGAVLRGRVHGQVFRIRFLLFGSGGNLRRRRAVQRLHVRGHAKRDSSCRRRAHGGSAGEGAKIRIVDSVYIYIGRIVLGIERRVLNLGRRASLDGVEIHRARKADADAGGSRHAAGGHLGNQRMGGGAVHHDSGLVFCRAVVAEFLGVRLDVQTLSLIEIGVLRPRYRDGVVSGRRTRRGDGAARDQRVGAAGDLVDADRRAESRPGACADVESSGEVVEAVVALRHDAHVVVRRELLVLDDGVHVVADVVVAAGARDGDVLGYGYRSPDADGMDVGVARSAHPGAPRVDRGGFPVVRGHFRFGILIDAVDGDARGSRNLARYGNVAHGAHGVDLALGIRRNINGGMRVCLILVDIRVVQGGLTVLVDVRDGGRALQAEPILAPAHAEARAHGGNAGLLQFIAIFFLLAVRGGNGNHAGLGCRNVGVVDLGPQFLLVLGRPDRGICHGAADAHFAAADGDAARDGGLFRNILRRDDEAVQIVERGILAVRLAVDDAFRVADAPVDGHGADGARKRLVDTHVHAARHGQRVALVQARHVDRAVFIIAHDVRHGDGIARQIAAGGVVQGVVGEGKPEGHAFAAGHFARDVENGGGIFRFGGEFSPGEASDDRFT